jgi:hypothetical protein
MSFYFHPDRQLTTVLTPAKGLVLAMLAPGLRLGAARGSAPRFAAFDFRSVRQCA